MNKNSSTQSLISALVLVLIFIAIIGGVIYAFNYFNSFQKDFMANDEKIEVLKEGSGEIAKQGDTVVVNYVGTLTDGTEFDNSYKRGQAFSVTIGEGRVIAGWEKGLLGIKVGEKRKLTIPPSLGYGERGVPNGQGGYLIPPNSELIFEIEAVEVHSRA